MHQVAEVLAQSIFLKVYEGGDNNFFFFWTLSQCLRALQEFMVFSTKTLLEFSLLQTVLIFGVLFKDIPIDILI